MQSKYCLPIIKSSKPEVLKLLAGKSEDYGYFEIWLDYIDALDDKFIDEVLSKYEAKLVFIFRRKDMSRPKLDQAQKIKIFNKLAGRKCYLDLDIYHQKDDLNLVKNHNLIISYHNYAETPEDEILDKVVKEIKGYRPAIVKISTMCVNPDDSLRLIRIKRDLLDQNQKHIVLGMGELGKITRVFGALWGNELIFIPENEENSSAPGQISRAEFDKIIGRIKKK